MTNKKTKAIEDIKEVRRVIQELNEAHQPAINQTLDGIINQLKQYLVKKQTRLENYVKKLREMTKDEVANGLLDSILGRLSDIGTSHSAIMKYDSEIKPPTELDNTEHLLIIISRLFNLIQKLQMIEDTLNTHIGDPQLEEED